MVDLCINFTFYGIGTLHFINEEMQQRIRHKIAEIFESARFGQIQEVRQLTTIHYQNQHAIPISDNYYGVENEMFLAFRFAYPLAHGDLGTLVGDGFHELYNFLPTVHNDIHLLIRTVFIHHDI